MAITALDTHQTVKELTAAGFSDSQAEALTQALRRAQDIDLSNLATRSDVTELRNATKADISELRNATKADISELRIATKADLATATLELRREMAEMKAELIKWGVGMAIGIVGATVALLRLLPGGHP